jgi:hypothetical protein
MVECPGGAPEPARRATRRSLCWLLATMALGCSSGPAAEGPASNNAGGEPLTSGTPLERLFPLVDRAVYQYVLEKDDGQDVLLGRVARTSANRGTLDLPGGRKLFEYAPDGIKLVSAQWGPVYVLKQPLSMGNRWRGEHGGTVEIIAVDAAVDVPAGHYEDCVQTLETRGGDRPLRVATTFCPDTGIVLLEAAAGATLERAALKSYGPPVEIGPDGVRRVQ